MPARPSNVVESTGALSGAGNISGNRGPGTPSCLAHAARRHWTRRHPGQGVLKRPRGKSVRLAEELKASDVGLEFLTGELKGLHDPYRACAYAGHHSPR
ncbi:hypothetical protein GCM10011579_016700 [Streptomyces albiflavescens]|uniref:Uncharacterized protein n=1 Tax=Streptomyces albiflavescens TaxID=1623582 RepID=A0A918D170_9ACTN|nr:hypothetical protein GCM10011579_016700 [Streptomyces albiflavescens]